MRTIETRTQFRRDFKNYRVDAEQIYEFIGTLAKDQQLPDAARDHALKGNWTGYRECHIKPDLLLIYKKPDEKTLRLVRIGTHSALFG